MNSRLPTATLAATTAIAVPIIARSAQDADTQQATVAQVDEQQGEEHRGGHGHWMRGEGGPGWRGMMMHRMMMRHDPKERCEERLAWRAAMRAYTESKLDLTSEQHPLWDKVESIAQSEQQKERQLCAALKPRDETTVLSAASGHHSGSMRHQNGHRYAAPHRACFGRPNQAWQLQIAHSTFCWRATPITSRRALAHAAARRRSTSSNVIRAPCDRAGRQAGSAARLRCQKRCPAEQIGL